MAYLNLILINIVPFLIVLSLLVYIHEMGHYIVARLNDVRVKAFSIGFGPEIFGWTNKHGVRWKVSYIPLGGYVKFADDDENDVIKKTSDPQAFANKTPWQRIAIAIAGPAANYGFAILVLAGLYATVGQKIPTNDIVVGEIFADSAAQKAGLKSGDVIIGLNGNDDLTVASFQKAISEQAGKEIILKVQKSESKAIEEVAVVPASYEEGGARQGRLGIGLIPKIEQQVHGVFGAFWHASVDTLNITVGTLRSFGEMIMQKRSSDGLSGPIGIAALTAKFAQQGLEDLIWFAAVLSISLGLINLFPVPMLDGGHILFCLIEGVRGKAVNEKTQEVAYRIGFALVLALILFSTWNDFNKSNLFHSIISWFK
jgi:regulator of sigma E protease